MMNTNEIAFDIDLARKIGLNEAIMVSVLNNLIQTRGKYFNDSKWVCVSYDELAGILPFMSRMTIRRTIYSLESQKVIITRIENRCKWYTLNYDQNEHRENSPENAGQVQEEHSAESGQKPASCSNVQAEHAMYNNCRKIYSDDKANFKTVKENSIGYTTEEDNPEFRDPAVQKDLSLKEIKNLLWSYDIEISWNKKAWIALKHLAKLTKSQIEQFARRLFSLQCAGIVKNPAGLLVARPAEIIKAFQEGTLYPSCTVEYRRSDYFPQYVYAV